MSFTPNPQPSSNTSPTNPLTYLQNLLDSPLRITVRDGRVFTGRLLCVDKGCNVVLMPAEEFLPDPSRMIRGERPSKIPQRLENGEFLDAKEVGEGSGEISSGKDEQIGGRMIEMRKEGFTHEGDDGDGETGRCEKKMENEKQKEEQEDEEWEEIQDIWEIRRKREALYPHSEPFDGPDTGWGGRSLAMVLIQGEDVEKIELIEQDGRRVDENEYI
ncbi:hypothetical protein TREMEDRAFT_59464 [Tremella mesenterica DSM 1558]|uniref:uncharacterized protein n=1 Tax=Tremella mesenterica (strain ATCC 24925 / CBS 8224 / DSM 1558 / NBRC 9311 / NRRL Y-6157 / RJB 2259-6 / UBC 559-6) TaxID=578456 RepID=UPI0003F4A34D|nr:uncharacterized protein TREMEDRAFT_59464 [Tremella mesenterica DSM 1558]EIW73299.1 hypothetical protein TREMEDRAFT_59464 [Tremella mesenterica DSM 1558]